MKYISLLLALLFIGSLYAEAQYVPYTILAEDFGSLTCGACAVAWEGLQVPLSNTHNGEFILAKLYTQSGDLTTPIVQDRFDYYEVIGIPALIFNGKIRVNGSGEGIADGSLYNAAINQFRYSSSPLSMDITNFSTTTGVLSGSIVMVSPTVEITNAKVVYYLLEDNIGAAETKVVRSILYDDINLTGAGSTFNFSKTFSISPTWNAANLWAIASVQLPDKAIVQNVSTLPLPEYNFRAAMDWNNNIIGLPNIDYTSQAFWLYNMGIADNYTMRIEVDSAPDGWYFNYCDADNCYSGNMNVPISLGNGESKDFHLNLIIGDAGVANFRFVLTSPNLGTYSIPFRYAMEGSANDDDTLVEKPMNLGNMYPNPITTNAELTVNSNKTVAAVNIDVFNIKGQKVQSLTAHNLVQGENRISFSPNASLPNGIYFYKLSGSAAPALKFILLK
ncbi:MAG: T9SS type A sorting domain-containing protein [Candidatus Cloacimonetes bacterium]|nr:T9SS type A sorting domain-containing protein [Candidatus Cloacimonadota bacterium]